MRLRSAIQALAFLSATLTPCLSASEWRTFVAAHRESILFLDTDAEVLKAVQTEHGALGLIEVHSIDNSVNVIHVDGKLPMEQGYLPH